MFSSMTVLREKHDNLQKQQLPCRVLKDEGKAFQSKYLGGRRCCLCKRWDKTDVYVRIWLQWIFFFRVRGFFQMLLPGFLFTFSRGYKFNELSIVSAYRRRVYE